MTAMYALVTNGVIQAVRNPGPAERRLTDNAWLCPVNAQWTQAEAAACGFLPITDTAQPADTATDTYDRSVQLVAGVPTVAWTQRPKTAEEIAAATSQANRDTITAQAQTALTNNTTYLAIGSPTNAQVVAQVRALTQQVNKVIRLVINQLDSTT